MTARRRKAVARLPAAEVDRYGFRWGPVDTLRTCSDHRGLVVEVSTAYRRLSIWVSSGGRSIRVYDEDGRELRPATERGRHG